MGMILSHDIVNAYLDDALEPERALEIAATLASRPGDAAAAEAIRAQCCALHALFDDVLRQPVPDRLRAVLRRHRAHTLRRRGGVRGAGTIPAAR